MHTLSVTDQRYELKFPILSPVRQCYYTKMITNWILTLSPISYYMWDADPSPQLYSEKRHHRWDPQKASQVPKLNPIIWQIPHSSILPNSFSLPTPCLLPFIPLCSCLSAKLACNAFGGQRPYLTLLFIPLTQDLAHKKYFVNVC